MDERNSKIIDFLKIVNCSEKSEKFIHNQQEIFENLKKTDEFQCGLKIHNALSHELRASIYQLLNQQELCTCALAEIVQMSEPTITHHLKILIDADLIIAEKQGLFTIYYTKENFRKKKFGN